MLTAGRAEAGEQEQVVASMCFRGIWRCPSPRFLLTVPPMAGAVREVALLVCFILLTLMEMAEVGREPACSLKRAS